MKTESQRCECGHDLVFHQINREEGESYCSKCLCRKFVPQKKGVEK